MRRDDFVDFFVIDDRHLDIHARLEQWARWVRVRPHGWQTAPMFRQYRSKAWQWERPEPRAAINVNEAVAMERAISALPIKHRDAVRWCYVTADSPSRMARVLAVTKDGLRRLVDEARQMLVNRKL